MPTAVANKKKQGALLPDAWRRRAPRNNQNARKHGLFTRQAKDERKQLYELLRTTRGTLKTIK